MPLAEANTVECSQYHKPDSRWEVFGGVDFASYIDNLVIKGLFHQAVPSAVVESYEVAEYIMAHSWYHYPLYDEALSKLLRITEMATKLRCQELRIPVVTSSKSGKGKNKTFDQLINDYCSYEPEKELKDQLHRIRRIRNIFMHPERHSYGLGMIGNLVRGLVNVLNSIFLPEQLFIQIKAQLRKINNHLNQFRQQPLVLIDQGRRYLIEQVKIVEAFPFNNQWNYCIAAIPVVNNLPEQLQTHSYTLPLGFEVQDLTLKDDGFSCTEISKANPVTVQITNHQDNVQTYASFIEARRQASEQDRWSYQSFQDGEMYKYGSRFLYNHQYRFNGISDQS
ncbi:MAG: hypothetical protein EOO89_15245 [Pedobacter sp.]|nr:MAG: hypothetical protein EOO89_15245 [Pedobacter sp.]